MHVIGQDDPGVDAKRRFGHHLPHRPERRLNLSPRHTKTQPMPETPRQTRNAVMKERFLVRPNCGYGLARHALAVLQSPSAIPSRRGSAPPCRPPASMAMAWVPLFISVTSTLYPRARSGVAIASAVVPVSIS